MTTAHRPTWHTAKGGTEQGGNVLVNPSRAYSSKDMPAHTKLKMRADGQGTQAEQSHLNFRDDLLRRELEGGQSALQKRTFTDFKQGSAGLALQDTENAEAVSYADESEE